MDAQSQKIRAQVRSLIRSERTFQVINRYTPDNRQVRGYDRNRVVVSKNGTDHHGEGVIGVDNGPAGP